ncbi:MAG: type II toxin-antitoxin system RelE/ParE family toxin [Clostridiales Family XIII bacterium]|jgi:plasmid stabilization system protein ParE|nr:type II toxin-antitoxin system RelE/ParE family toxin [Clostridiales Family XIII bacterium]
MSDEKYTIRILPTYLADLQEIIYYIRDVLKNKTAAQNFLDKTAKAIEERAYNPFLFAPYSSRKRREHAYYPIYVGNFIIFYVIIGDVMEVRRLIYNARNIDNLL